LFFSCANKNPEFTELLIKRNANLHIKNYMENTLLHIAVQHNNLKVMEILLNNGADPQSPNMFGVTPLDTARHFNRAFSILKTYITQ
jgi:ankyrin repeat protein